MRTVRFPADHVHVQEFEHSDGAVDLFTIIRAPEAMFASLFGLQSERRMTVLMPLYRNTGGDSDFEDVNLDADERVFEMTEVQYEAFREQVIDMVGK